MTITLPLRRMTRHFSQILLTDARTFILFMAALQTQYIINFEVKMSNANSKSAFLAMDVYAISCYEVDR